MVVHKYRQSYPVIHGTPGLGLIIRNFNFRDYLIIFGVGLTGWPVGYIVGKPLRSAFAKAGLVVSMTASIFLAMQNSAGRLIGFRENQVDAEYYPYRLDFTNYQVRTEPYRTIIQDEKDEILDYPRF